MHIDLHDNQDVSASSSKELEEEEESGEREIQESVNWIRADFMPVDIRGEEREKERVEDGYNVAASVYTV